MIDALFVSENFSFFNSKFLGKVRDIDCSPPNGKAAENVRIHRKLPTKICLRTELAIFRLYFSSVISLFSFSSHCCALSQAGSCSAIWNSKCPSFEHRVTQIRVRQFLSFFQTKRYIRKKNISHFLHKQRTNSLN